MPATPFPHPSVHTTTTVHSLTCSRIRALAHSLMYRLAGSAQSLGVTQSRCINANKSENAPSKTAENLNASQCGYIWKSSSHIAHLDEGFLSSADLRLSCDTFLECLDSYGAQSISLKNPNQSMKSHLVFETVQVQAQVADACPKAGFTT